jgi:hypothetical protein
LTATSFAEAMYIDATNINDRILQLPNSVYRVDESMRGGSLFARDRYEKLWDCVSNDTSF